MMAAQRRSIFACLTRVVKKVCHSRRQLSPRVSRHNRIRYRKVDEETERRSIHPTSFRKEDEYFEDLKDEKIPKDRLQLASHIVETKSGHFEPEKFEDQYEDALILNTKAKRLAAPTTSGIPSGTPW
jgi:hypothetical protein